MTQYLNTKHILMLFVSTLLVACCGKVPQATLNMSILLGEQIDFFENDYVRMVNLYYENEKLRTREDADRELHLLLEDFFKKDSTQKIWKISNPEKRTNTLTEVVREITKVYTEVLNQQIELLEKSRIESLMVAQAKYQDAKKMNGIISENISSVYALQKARKPWISQDVKNREDALQKAENIELRKNMKLRLDSLLNDSEGKK